MSAQRRLTLAVVSAGTAMLLLDVTVVNVALPVIRDDLDASFAELQWVIDAYALTLAATLLTVQQVLRLSPTDTGLRLLPITVVLLLVAPLSGKATSRVPLRIPLVAGLLLIGASLLLMRDVTVADDWTHLLPGSLVAGLAIGVISPALAAAMVGVLSVEQRGLASGVNNTFRQLDIAAGVRSLHLSNAFARSMWRVIR